MLLHRLAEVKKRLFLAAHFAAHEASREDVNVRRRIERVQLLIWHADRAAEWAASSGITKFGRLSARAARRAARYAAKDRPSAAFRQMGLQQAAMLRDIFGHIFHPAVIERAWRTNTVAQLATQIYEERAFDQLPILGDALEEAGCSNGALLDHCRGAGPHVRGCWAIDLLTGRG
jgi:hypothetical protein